MATATIPNDIRDAFLTAVTDALDGGYVEIRTGTAPDPDAPATGTLLATIPLNSPAFTTPTNGEATAITTPTLQADGLADGEAGWFRAYAPDDSSVLDGGAATIVASADVATGLPVRITAWTLTMPDGS